MTKLAIIHTTSATVESMKALAAEMLVVLGDATVVLQSFGPRRLVAERCHRDVTDLQQFGRREEHHVRRVVVQRVA